MTSDVVAVERVGAALAATIDRESSGNAISREVVVGLVESVRAAEAAEDISALVITGRGGKFFAAGGDLKQYRDIGTREELAADLRIASRNARIGTRSDPDDGQYACMSNPVMSSQVRCRRTRTP